MSRTSRARGGALTYETFDSGARATFPSGMVRDTDEGKARFDLILAPGIPLDEQMLTRWAALMARGAVKYGDANWTLANSVEELERMKASAFRHFVAWMVGETDEDHAAAVMANILFAETTAWKLEEGQ